MQKFEYSVTCAVCTRTSPKELQILKKYTQKVFASPSRRSMDCKGDNEEISYPNIFFTVDNYDEVFIFQYYLYNRFSLLLLIYVLLLVIIRNSSKRWRNGLRRTVSQ